MKKNLILLIFIIYLSSMNVYAENNCVSVTGCKNCNNSIAESSCKSTQEYKDWIERQSNLIADSKYSSKKSTKSTTSKENNSSEINCNTLFGTNTETGKILHDIYNIIKVVVPIILLAMSIKDFGGGLLSQNDKALREALIRFSKRLVIAILILVLPTILNFILKLLEIDTCFL